ncbi:unnamed protein product [Onchocerca flexuosa]|uniref:Uncharacterized protein n=1 Tax=Onchocerca flexuosa TaxID=387005 RepID=A0A183HM46_9BILA|nr:unnamed protein product [Onchocerca flexuosa]
MLSTTVTTTVTTTTSSTIGQGNDASSGRSTQLQQSHQQLGTPSIQQMQPSMFPQGIHFFNKLAINFVCLSMFFDS